VLGNPSVLWTGLQDNGTRWRLSENNLVADLNVNIYDQLMAATAIGDAMASDPAGRNMTYWASVNGSRRFCKPSKKDCSKSTHFEANGTEVATGRAPNFTLPSGDGNPFHPLQPHVRLSAGLCRQLLQSEHVAPGNQRQRRALSGCGSLPREWSSRAWRAPRAGSSTRLPIPTTNLGGLPARVYGSRQHGASALLIDNGVATQFVPAASVIQVDVSGTLHQLILHNLGRDPARPEHFGPPTRPKVCS